MKNLIDIQDFQRYDNLEFIAKQVVEGFITGLHKSPFHGFSVEFAEHRMYNEGESTKNIDWKLFARTDKLFVKRFEEETNLRCQIIIDTSSSMLFPFRDKKIFTKLAFSVFSAAALSYLLRKQRDAVGLTLFSDNIELQTHSRSSLTHLKFLYAQLDNLLMGIDSAKHPEKKPTDAAKVLHLISEKIHKRSLVIIFSDMMDSNNTEELFNAMQHLRHNKHEVILFHVTDKQHEKDLKYPNRPIKFVDLETGEEMKFNPNELRTDYKKGMEQFYESIKLKCGQFNIDFVEADINEGFNEILLPFLLKRSKMF